MRIINIKKHIVSLLILLGSFSISAQQSTNTGGGEANGSGGSSSFTVGQTDYSTSNGTSGSVSEGVQQAYVISDTNISVKQVTLAIKLIAYPNPTSDILTLEIDKKMDNVSYQVLDINGKVISEGKVTELKTEIVAKSMSSGTYFLYVKQKNETIKTFKIIKN